MTNEYPYKPKSRKDYTVVWRKLYNKKRRMYYDYNSCRTFIRNRPRLRMLAVNYFMRLYPGAVVWIDRLREVS